jgi:hypothetical protein
VFFPNSRYSKIETVQFKLDDGREILYVRRRFLPQADSLETQAEHMVTQGERLDNITALDVGDPEQYWQICDANNAMRPEELEEQTGRRLRIPVLQGD